MFSRRDFLITTGALGGGLLLPGLRAHERGTLLDARALPKFVNPLPNPLAPDFVFRPDAPGTQLYTIAARPLQSAILGPGLPATPVWGYGSDTQAATYPGRSFVARRGQPLTVRWRNELQDEDQRPLPHLLPVDTSLHWADPLHGEATESGPYTGPVPIVTHLHGGHNASGSDGLPDAWFTPGNRHTGRLFQSEYVYDNDQEAATLWYHDHALGITRLNVYAGLAGFYLLRDENENALVAAGSLPSGPHEVPIVIQDRMFTADGRLHYPAGGAMAPPDAPEPSVLPEFFGDVMVVNGKAWPVLDVEPRAYRLRLLNGCDSRFLELDLTPSVPLWQIGGDAGLLAAPVPEPALLLGPGERLDIVVDFARSAGRTLVMRNRARSPYPNGTPPDPRTTGRVMAFRVLRPFDGAYPGVTLPASLKPPQPAPAPARRTRQLMLFEGTDRHGRLQPMLGIVDPGSPHDGTLLWDDPVTETPGRGDTEIWEVFNATADSHPIHVHLVSLRLLDRQKFRATIVPKPMAHDSVGGKLTRVQFLGAPRAPAPEEAGPKDTVLMHPGEVTRIAMHFDRCGEYVWHCHILSHEDHEMMRPFVVE